jgi:hypothetical protein
VDQQHNDMSDFLRRIVADACARMALVEADANLRRLPVAEHWSGKQARSGRSAERAGAPTGRQTTLR